MIGYAARGGIWNMHEADRQQPGPQVLLARPPLWLKVAAVFALLAGIGLMALAAAAGFVVLLLLIPVFVVLWAVRAVAVRINGADQSDDQGRDNVRVIDRDGRA